jgi:SAM-dependent methyltransferase
LEVGCGAGFVLTAVREAFPGLELTGTDVSTERLAHARDRLPGVRLIELDALEPPPHTFDVVCAFDVLEHIPDDGRVLTRIFEATAPRGGAILLVPQHPRLWSAADDYGHHVRRYTRPELIAKLEEAGFRATRATSFLTALLPIMVAARLRHRGRAKQYDLAAELVPPRPLNSLFERILDGERWLIDRGVSLPVGGSLLVVARRGDDSAG